MAELKVDVDLDTEKGERKARKNLKKAGSEIGSEFQKSFNNGIKTLVSGVLLFKAVASVKNFFKESISAAATQEQAINDLNTQLAITGQFTEETSRGLQEFAAQLQETSRFGDEAVLSQLAFAQAMGATAEQSKLAVSAGADLAESLNIDLNSAVRNVSKTLGGYAGELGEVIPELKALTQEQLQAGEGITLIAEKFGGAAAARIRTFAGAIAQLSNTFGDFQEAIGKVVTNSPALISVINTTSKVIGTFTRNLNSLSEGDPLKGLLLGAISVARAFNEIVLPPVQFVFKVIQIGLKTVQLSAQTLFTGLAIAIDETIGRLLRTLAVLPGAVGKAAQSASDIIANVRDGAQELVRDQASDLANDIFSDNQQETLNDKITQILNAYQAGIEGAKKFRQATGDAFEGVRDDAQKAADALNNTVKNGIVNLISQSFQELGKVLTGTGGGFKAFVGVIISALGDMAISIGTTVIGAAFAIDALKKSLVGAPLAAIALGGALVAAGAALKVFGSSLGGDTGAAPSVSGFGSSAGQGISTDDQFSPTSVEERAEPETRVAININGDVFDSSETGLRIARILEESSLNENVRIVGGLA